MSLSTLLRDWWHGRVSVTPGEERILALQLEIQSHMSELTDAVARIGSDADAHVAVTNAILDVMVAIKDDLATARAEASEIAAAVEALNAADAKLDGAEAALRALVPADPTPADPPVEPPAQPAVG